MYKEMIIVGIEKFRFTDKETGEIIEGSKIHFLEKSDNSDGRFGFLPRSLNVRKDFSLPVGLPCVCEAVFDLDFTYKKPSTRLVKLEKVRDFDLESA